MYIKTSNGLELAYSKRLYNKIERIPDEEFHKAKTRFINFMQN
jgi:hypothetical protein